MFRWVLLAFLLLPAPAPAFEPVLVAQASARVSLAEAIEIVKRRTGGQVLSAKSEGGSYKIKVLTPNGEVLVLTVDAETGAVR